MWGSVGTILLVDDDAQIRRLIQMTLGAQGHTLIEAGDGGPALEMARRERPDLMIVDLAMPGVDGIEVCREIKSSPETRDIHVVILTARAGEGNRRQALEAGANVFMIKPFSPLALLRLVEDLLAV
jgi:CheY-like chemotaxis protein